MLMNEQVARTKWCPMVRVEGDNRVFNTISDGFEDTGKLHCCIGSLCMSWREFHLSHIKGDEPTERHGYCGLAGRPELE